MANVPDLVEKQPQQVFITAILAQLWRSPSAIEDW